MTRKVLADTHIHPAIADAIGGSPEHRQTVDEVINAIRQHNVVIVGMRQNPHPKKACQLLDAAGIPYHYMEYGSYFSEWKRRGALKMWSGWYTFPMVFVKGQLVGGCSDMKRLLDSGELARLLG
jgi:glutaredoxin-related protein